MGEGCNGWWANAGAVAFGLGVLALPMTSCMDGRDFLDDLTRRGHDHGGPSHSGDGGRNTAGSGGAGIGGATGAGGMASGVGAGGSPADAGSGGACGASTGATCSVPGCGASSSSPTLLPGITLTGVWVGPAGEVWAVGQGGFVGRRAPETNAWCWCAPNPPTSLSSVWGLDSDHLFVVGASGMVLRLDGGRWVQDFPTGFTVNAISGTGADNIWAVGDRGTILRYDGTSSWESHSADPKYSLNAVWIDPTGVVRVAGNAPITGGEPGSSFNDEAVVLRPAAAGTEGWVVEASFPQRGRAVINGMSGSSATDAWAVGANQPSGAATGIGLIAHFDGAAWTLAGGAELVTTVHSMTDVAGSTPDAGATWIVGGVRAVRFDGTDFTMSPDLMLARTGSIDARGASMYAVGGEGIIMRWSGTDWVVDRAPTPAPLNAAIP